MMMLFIIINVDNKFVKVVKEFANEHIDSTSLLVLGGMLLPSPASDVCRYFSVRRMVKKIASATNEVKRVSSSFGEVCESVQNENIISKTGLILVNVNNKVVEPLGEIIDPVRRGVKSGMNLLTQGNGFVETVVDYIKGLFNIEYDFWSVGTNVYQIITELLYSLLNSSFEQFIVSFINIVRDMGLLSSDWVKSKLDTVVNLFKKIMTSQTQSDLTNSDLIDQGEIALLDEDKKTLIGLLFGGILTTIYSIVYTQGW